MNMAVATDQGILRSLNNPLASALLGDDLCRNTRQGQPWLFEGTRGTAFAPIVQLSPMVIGPYSFVPGPI